MRAIMFLKLITISLCVSLLSFALIPDFGLIEMLKILALGMVLSISITAFYPDIRGVKSGDKVSVVTNSALPGIIGRIGMAAADGRKNDQIKIVFQNGSEVLGIIESYVGLISPAKIRIVYEERLMD